MLHEIDLQKCSLEEGNSVQVWNYGHFPSGSPAQAHYTHNLIVDAWRDFQIFNI